MQHKIHSNIPDLWLSDFPVPQPHQHKYDRGHVLVLSGAMESTGAARLAARGALRAGAGLVTLASPLSALSINAAASLAVMVKACNSAETFFELLRERRVNAAVIGPGGGIGAHMRDYVLRALESKAGLVLDADALTSFADHLDQLVLVIKGRKAATILTPHEGEFARLFQERFFVDRPREERACAAANLTGAITVLKGAHSIVATPDGNFTIADNAPPTLATAGAGDVLAGIIAGLLAQGMPGFLAASAGVWVHGEAARKFGLGLISEDLPEMLPAVYSDLSRQIN